MNQSIYIVEDEIIVALEIKSAILKLGYSFAGLASNYTDAYRGIMETSPDLILMDITLKQSKNGVELARTLQKQCNIPIIYLTSITDEATMHEAIKTAPIGYLVKPFRRDELRSTILLGFYKASHEAHEKTSFRPLGHGYHYDEKNNQLFFDKEYIKLGPKEKTLLSLLIKANGNIVPFKILEEVIWEGKLISDSTIRTLIYRLNLKLDYKLIETIPTRGCRILLSNTEEYSFEKS